MDARPVLLGMNNPLSLEPRHALAPYPERSAGHRLWRVLDAAVSGGCPRGEYLRSFDRRNLLQSRKWSARDARAAGAVLLPELAGREVVVLGAQTWQALGLARVVTLGCVLLLDGPRLHSAPHPSGRKLWYNDEQNRASVGALLARLLEEWRRRA